MHSGYCMREVGMYITQLFYNLRTMDKEQQFVSFTIFDLDDPVEEEDDDEEKDEDDDEKDENEDPDADDDEDEEDEEEEERTNLE